MLSKKFRLPLSSNRAILKKNGITHRGRYIALISLPNNLSHSRAGIIVSKKISPSAVVRNKLKRSLSASIELWIKTHSPNTDFLILPHKNALNASFSDINTDLHNTLHHE